ncbi:MAG: UDP-4-amino-4,6-dideoxy-N-acetyl-beta-L-altrosamine transaminase [Candidatus Magasanikbacteria bacterium]|nr:UDP-4-amino-4,6-dideoxy-N-acetyl-beta-L-altrosamine transaminase [Candidatus Magasanikbacteria bacterium]
MIPYSHQHIDEADIEAVIKVLKSDWLTQGPNIAAFEKSLAAYCDTQYAVVVPNGTAALHLAYMAAGLAEGDEIITSANTFVATANMAIACGAKPVLCDIRADTYNIDETKIEALISERTKAIVPVHFGGHPCEMEAIWAIAKKHSLLVIEDACHALGAQYKGKKIGGLSDMALFSFHPVKPITTGEGGAILTNNKQYYDMMLKLRTHGIVKDPEKQKAIGGWYYEMENLGYNYRITDIQCALGYSQLSKLDAFHARREEIARYYFDKLKNVPGVIPPTLLEHVKTSWHLFPIMVKDASRRKEVFAFLQSQGIGVQVHYIPVYKQPYYQRLGYDTGAFPNTEQYYNSCISLPIYPDLTNQQIDFVVEQLSRATS